MRKSAQSLYTYMFILLFLLVGFSACKGREEPKPEPDPETPTEPEPDPSTDTFLKHLLSTETAGFFVGEYGYFYPTTGVNSNVDAVNVKTANDYSVYTSVHYDSDGSFTANRIDVASTDGTAYFAMRTYNFTVIVNETGETWKLEGVPSDIYLNKYKTMSNSELASVAREYFDKSNADPNYAKNICDAITAGNGQWTFQEGKIGVFSKGAEIGMHYSDIGLVQGTKPIAGEPGKYELRPYMGGMNTDFLGTKTVNSSKFTGKAYIYVMPTDKTKNPYLTGGDIGTGLQVFETDSAAATLSCGIDVDTIIMPFKDWYTVTVISNRANNEIKLSFDNYKSGLSESKWGMTTTLYNNLFVVKRELKPAGLMYYFGGFKEGDNSVDVSVSVPVSYGDRDGGEKDVEQIGFVREYVGNIGREIGFVFGGIKQKPE